MALSDDYMIWNYKISCLALYYIPPSVELLRNGLAITGADGRAISTRPDYSGWLPD